MDGVTQELFDAIVEKIEANDGVLTTNELDALMEKNPLYDLIKSLYYVSIELEKVYTCEQLRDESNKFIGCKYTKKHV